jgi:hypothetical protein
MWRSSDALHDTLSGSATQHLMQRVLLVFGNTRTARLAENGALVRKCFGDSHPQRYAMQINAFCATYLNPQLPSLPVRRGH